MLSSQNIQILFYVNSTRIILDHLIHCFKIRYQVKTQISVLGSTRPDLYWILHPKIMLQIIQLRRTGLYLAQLNYIYIGSSHLKSMLQNIQVKTHMSLFRSTRPAYIGSSHPRQKTHRSLLRSTRTRHTGLY